MTAWRTRHCLVPCSCSERRSGPAARCAGSITCCWPSRKKSERLLLNVLPASIAARLKDTDEVIADAFADVTVLFADIVDFTRRSQQIAPEQVVQVLNGLFSAFNQLAKQRGLEKIKTIGDAYMVVGACPTHVPTTP